MLSVPILAGSRMVGVINVQSEERREFDKPDTDFLAAISGQVAGIIERSEMQRRLEARRDRWIRIGQDQRTGAGGTTVP